MEPTTATVAFEIIVAVAQAAKEIEEQRNFTRWKDDVSDKLDSILRNTETIIADLKRLRVDFREELRVSFQTEYLNRLKGELLNIAAILGPLADGEKLTDKIRERLVNSVERIRTLAYSSATYGTAVAPTALTALAVMIPAMKMAGLSAGEIAITKIQLHQTVITPLLDPARPESLVSSYRSLQESAATDLQRISAALGPVTLGAGLTNQTFAGHQAFEQWLYDVVTFTTSVSGDAEKPDSFVAEPIGSRVAMEQTSPSNIVWVVMNNPQPPLDESGVIAYRRDLAEALRIDILNNAKALSRRRLGYLENARELAVLIEAARRVLQ